jgi:ubiquinol-cytochrome c reductase cytochrome b subunit
LHYFLSIIVLGLSLLHLILLHEVGSTSPNGRKPDTDYTKFFPYYYLKDLSTLLIFLLLYLLVVFYKPNMFGHPDNYIRASALVTPAHIVPE